MVETGPPETKLLAENSLSSTNYDGLLLVSHPSQKLNSTTLQNVITKALKYDPTLESEVAILPLPEIPAGRLVHSPTGPIDPDYDDVRIYKKAAKKAVKRALKAGIRRPLLVLQDDANYENVELVTLLGALEALYVPIQLREIDPSKKNNVDHLGVYTSDPDKTNKLINLATVLETGRRVACDIGDADPERMAPPKVEQYVTSVFSKTSVKVNVVKDVKQIAKEYPLFEAVNRAASVVERHQGRIIFLEYTPTDPSKIEETLLFVGKGVTYDTGGADIKAGGVMAGMSRDKCGAAAVAGFMKVVADLKPSNVKVIAGMSMVRNSVGSNCYVADELIPARSGVRVRIGNTDAEGRMVMADVLCKMKETAVNEVNPHLFTVATLTGHCLITVGEGYTIVMDNGPARKANNAQRMQTGGDAIGDPFEISTIRREDIDFHKGKGVEDDVFQANNLPSSSTCRGHQGPAGFLILTSGLDKHGSGNAKPLKYSHIDVAGSAGSLPNPATGAPVLALANTFLLNNKNVKL